MSNWTLVETVIEDAERGWFQDRNWQVLHGPEIAPDDLRVKDAKRFIGRHA